jgi:hypothetical protein
MEGCTIGSREVPGERKPVIRDDDDDDIKANNDDNNNSSCYNLSYVPWYTHNQFRTMS